MRELTQEELSALKPGTLIKIEGHPDIFRGLAFFEAYDCEQSEIKCFTVGAFSEEIISDSHQTVALLDDSVVLLPSVADIKFLRSWLSDCQFLAEKGSAS